MNVDKKLSDFHFLKLGPDTLENPYPFFKRLRAEEPVFREPDYGVYLVSTYDGVEDVSRRTDIFSSIAVSSGPYLPLPTSVDTIDEYRAAHHDMEKLIHNDPPDHARYRSFVGALFTPRRVAELEPELTDLVDRLIDGFINDGEVEFMQRFAYVLPLMVVGNLLGVPAEDNARFKMLFEDAFSKMDEYFFGNPDAPRVEVPHYPVLGRYFTEELLARRKAPGEDIMSKLATATFPDGSEIPIEEVVRICVFLYSAGGDSNTPQILTNGMKILATRPDIARQLKADPSLIPRFVEEVLRFETSALGLFRLARQETCIADKTVPKGAFAMLLYASGNRDEKYFDDPEEFRLDRPKRRVLSFGSGIHTCPGAPLARLQTEIAFRRIIARMEDIEINQTQRTFAYLPSSILRSVRRLEVKFAAAA